MIFRYQSLRALKLFGALLLLLLVLPLAADAQIPDIVVTVGDTTGLPNTTNTVISIYLNNQVDTIFGFNLWLQLDRPDLMLFQTDTATIYDTTYWTCNTYSGPDCTDSTERASYIFDSIFWECIDPPACTDSQLVTITDTADLVHTDIYLDTIGNIDVTGTLVENWDLIDARSLSGVGTDINIVGIADLPGGGTDPGIPAGQQGGVLVKILADILDVPSEEVDRTVDILVQTDFKDRFGFVRPDGSLINWLPAEIEDTNCYVCEQWIGNVCLSWQKVSPDFFECDSTEVFLDTVLVLDTANVKVFDGSLTVLSAQCGDVNSDIFGNIDISDLLYLVDFFFLSPPGPAPDPLCLANVDCSLEVDISDLLYLIDYFFLSPAGPAPCQTCCQ